MSDLYHAANRLMAHIGAVGEVNSRDEHVSAVMDALYAIDGGEALAAELGKSKEAENCNLAARVEVLKNSLKNLLTYAETTTCLHEETYRGGAIWEICSYCGIKWADDRGGKPHDAHEYPKPIKDAQEVIDNLPARTEATRRVLEAADKFHRECLHSTQVQQCADCFEFDKAIREWRKHEI